MSKSFIIIDLQWYRFNGFHLVPKELATCDNEHKISHFIFRPFISYGSLNKEDRNVANYVFNEHHRLKWEDGFISLDEFDDIIKHLCYNVRVVYVKGCEKATFLKSVISNAKIVDLIEAPKIVRDMPSCTFHKNSFCVCALTNVKILYNYLQNKNT